MGWEHGEKELQEPNLNLGKSRDLAILDTHDMLQGSPKVEPIPNNFAPKWWINKWEGTSNPRKQGPDAKC
jgi:hypothetical protein